MKLLFITVGLLLVSFSSATRKLPSYIQVCHPNHEDLTECIQKNLKILRPKFRNGIPELLIPPINPFKLASAQATIGGNIKGSLKDIQLWVKDFIIEEFKIDLENFDLKIKVTFPEVRGEANYKVSGRVLILNLDGNGVGKIKLNNLTAVVDARGKKEVRKGKEYLVPTSIVIKPTLKKMDIRLDNLFPQHPELTDQANKLFNDNQEVLFDEFSPFAVDIIKGMLSNYINNFFSSYSWDVLFPDD